MRCGRAMAGKEGCSGAAGGSRHVVLNQPVQGDGANSGKSQVEAVGVVGTPLSNRAPAVEAEVGTAATAAASGSPQNAAMPGLRVGGPRSPPRQTGQQTDGAFPAPDATASNRTVTNDSASPFPTSIHSLPLKLIRRICTLLPIKDVVNLSLALPSRRGGMKAHAPTAWAGEWAKELNCPLYVEPTWRLLPPATVRRVLLLAPTQSTVSAVGEGKGQSRLVGREFTSGGARADRGGSGGGGGNRGSSLLQLLRAEAKATPPVGSSLSCLQHLHQHLPYIEELRTVEYEDNGKPIFSPIPHWFPLSVLCSSLTYLECAMEQITHSHLLALPSLTTLVLSMAGNDTVPCERDGPYGFTSILSKFGRRFVKLMKAAGMLPCLQELRVHLRRLEFGLSLGPDWYPTAVTPFASLRVLHIASVVVGDDEFVSLELSQLAPLPSLESLTVEAYYLDSPPRTFSRLAALTELKVSLEAGGYLHLPLFPQLRSLDVTLARNLLIGPDFMCFEFKSSREGVFARDVPHLTAFKCTAKKGIDCFPWDTVVGLRGLQELDVIVDMFEPPPHVSLVSLLTRLTRLSLTEMFGTLPIQKGVLRCLVRLKELRLVHVIVPDVIADIRQLRELEDVVLQGYMRKARLSNDQYYQIAVSMGEPFTSLDEVSMIAAGKSAMTFPWEAHEYVLRCGDMSRIRSFVLNLRDGPETPPLVLDGKLPNCRYLHLRTAWVDLPSWAAGTPNLLTLTLSCSAAWTISAPPPCSFSRLLHVLIGARAAASVSEEWFALPSLLSLEISTGLDLKVLPELPGRLQVRLAAAAAGASGGAVVERTAASAAAAASVAAANEVVECWDLEHGQQCTGEEILKARQQQKGIDLGIRLRKLTLDCPSLSKIPSSFSLLTMLEDIYVPSRLTSCDTFNRLPASVHVAQSRPCNRMPTTVAQICDEMNAYVDYGASEW